MNIKGMNLYAGTELVSEEELMYSENLVLVNTISRELKESYSLAKDNFMIYDFIAERSEWLKKALIKLIKSILNNCTLSEEERKDLERNLVLLEGPNFVISNASFDKKINPIDCILPYVSLKKIEIVSKIIKPIKEKIISVTDLLIIGSSRVLRI